MRFMAIFPYKIGQNRKLCLRDRFANKIRKLLIFYVLISAQKGLMKRFSTNIVWTLPRCNLSVLFE